LWKVRGVSKAGPDHRSAPHASPGSAPKPAASTRRRCGPRPSAVHDLDSKTTQAKRPPTRASLDVRFSAYRAIHLKIARCASPHESTNLSSVCRCDHVNVSPSARVLL
jgi:hypothetical protein